MTRTGLDANILLRVMLNDDVEQSAQAKSFLRSLGPDHQGHVGISVLLEIFWVLKSRYGVPKSEIARIVDRYLTIEWLEIEDFAEVKRAIMSYRDDGADFPDALLAERNRKAGCTATLTFDKTAAGRVDGMELLS